MSARKPGLWPLFAVCQLVIACGSDAEGNPGPPPRGELEERVARVLKQLTLEEKIEQMHGTQTLPIEGLYHTPDNTRLGIPGFRMVDGPRGVRAGNATTFPVGMAVRLEFPAKDLAYWDEASAGWVVEPISYTIEVGASSRNARHD